MAVAGDEHLADEATRQLRDTFALFVADGRGETRQTEHIWSYASGMRAFIPNGCVVTGPATAAELNAALEWVEDRAELYLVTIDARFHAPLAIDLEARGIATDEPISPGMVLDPIGDLPGPPDGVTLDSVDAGKYEDWLAIAAEVFLPAEVARAVFPPSLLVSPLCGTVLASIDGRYVGSATAVHTGDVAGIYSVGTLEQARRRGVGRATTAAVIRLAHERWGVGRIFLQSSAMGFPVYSALGFRTVSGYYMLAGGLQAG